MAALLVAACALSPQVVQIQPALEPVQNAGSSAPATITLEVTDMRKDAVVGYRGGVYATASISTAEDTTKAVRDALAGALSARGFRILDPGLAGDIGLTVEIAELSYVARQDGVKRVIETVAAVRAKSVSRDVTRTGEYRDRRTKEVLKPPAASENAELVNAVLSAALQRVVADPDLLKY
jgi:uncharacterized lipoprotein